VGLTAVNGSATTAIRSDAAPPLSASVQSALTAPSTQILIGTGAFGFSSISAAGVDTNAATTKTANYTAANIDCGAPIFLGGNALFTLTINAANHSLSGPEAGVSAER
jgi:hypothetical protein